MTVHSVMSNVFNTEGFAMAISLSYREKSLYASLVAELVVYGPISFCTSKTPSTKSRA